jgi:SAM-dependent methyltransferase
MPLLACARGEIPANVALMRLCMAAPDEAALGQLLATLPSFPAEEAARLDQIATLWRRAPGAFRTVKALIGAVDHSSPAASPEDQLAACAAAFDHAAMLSPEGSVALYSLGSPALLDQATREIVDRMREWGLTGHGKAALEIGCGNGRVLAALSPELGRVAGLDISPAMIAQGRRRCAGLRNVALAHTTGQDLAPFEDRSLDLVLAVDSFPYIVQCGAALTARHFAEAARVLKPGGGLLILNFSYRGDLERDRAEVAQLAGGEGFSLLRNGTKDLTLWDGVTFLLKRSDL